MRLSSLRAGGVAALALLFASALPAVASLYVSSDVTNVVGEYNATTGVAIGPFAPSVNGTGQLGLALNGAGTRMLVGHFGGGVDEYDVPSGTFIKSYNAGPTVGAQWAGIYAPNGNVYISSWTTNDVREYDATTGAFVRVVTPVFSPADMEIGPNGNLFICSFQGGFVLEVNAASGAFVNQWSQPVTGQTNDIAFLPNGEILVTVGRINQVVRYDSSYNLLGTFAGTGWANTHGIEISPFDGNIYVVDGVTAQVHQFDPVTFSELSAGYLSPAPTSKIVDLVFRVPEPATLGLLLPVLIGVARRRR